MSQMLVLHRFEPYFDSWISLNELAKAVNKTPKALIEKYGRQSLSIGTKENCLKVEVISVEQLLHATENALNAIYVPLDWAKIVLEKEGKKGLIEDLS